MKLLKVISILVAFFPTVISYVVAFTISSIWVGIKGGWEDGS